MKSLKQCMSLVLAAVLGVTGMVSGHIADVQAQNCEMESTKYVGYEDTGAKYTGNIYGFKLNMIPYEKLQEIRPEGSTYVEPEEIDVIRSESEIVYCMDPVKHMPVNVVNRQQSDWTYYSAYKDITKDEIKASCTHASYAADPAYEETLKGLAWVAVNGYPNGTSEIRGNLNDDEFRAVTQWAVYHYCVRGSYIEYFATKRPDMRLSRSGHTFLENHRYGVGVRL